MRILLVEDELLLAQTITSILTSVNHIIVATAGEMDKTLQSSSAAKIDLAIIDININGTSSEPIVRKLTEQEIPVLLISGISVKQRPPWSEAYRLLYKPFRINELLDAIYATKS